MAKFPMSDTCSVRCAVVKNDETGEYLIGLTIDGIKTKAEALATNKWLKDLLGDAMRAEGFVEDNEYDYVQDDTTKH